MRRPNRSPGTPAPSSTARRRMVGLCAGLGLVAGGLGACGSGGSTASTLSGTGLTVHATDTLKFDKGSYTAAAGDLVIGYVNDGSIPHTLDIEGKGFELKVDGSKKTDQGTINLAPGTYTIYCDVPGHRASGMQAQLDVK